MQPITVTSAPFTTIKDALERKRATLKEWDKQFAQEKDEIAARIANNLFKDVFEILEVSTTDPNYISLNKDHPRGIAKHFDTAFHFGRSNDELKAGNCFFQTLVKTQKATKAKESFVENAHLYTINRYLKELAISTQEILKYKLTDLQSQPGFGELGFNVEWISPSEKAKNGGTLTMWIWINEQEVNNPASDKLSGSKPKASS